MNRSEFDWAPHIDELSRRWLAGESASQIARAIGRGATRCSVIGKIHRLGIRREALSAPGRRATPSPAAPRAPRPVRPPAPVLVRPACRDEPFVADGIPLIDRGSTRCAWPVGDERFHGTAEMMVCGRFVEGETSWCAEHAKRAFDGKSHSRINAYDANVVPVRAARRSSAMGSMRE